MRGIVSPEVAQVLQPFHGRYSSCPTKHVVELNPTTRRILVDPVLLEFQAQDIALWIIAARNRFLVRSVIGSLAVTPGEVAWESAWCLAWAAITYKLPTISCSTVYSPTAPDIIERVLSLSWKQFSDHRVLHKMPECVKDYRKWMALYRELPSLSGSGIKPIGGEATSHMDLPATENLGNDVLRVAVPNVERQEILWALNSTTEEERDRWHNMPNPNRLASLASLGSEFTENTTLQLGHIGKREAMYYAAGIYTPYGRVREVAETATWAVYVDVSASMTAYASAAWSLVKSIDAKFYVFSGVVREAEPDADSVETDNSTDYTVLVEHIREHKHKHVVILSDDGDSLTEDELDFLSSIEVKYLRFVAPQKKQLTLSSLDCVRIDL